MKRLFTVADTHFGNKSDAKAYRDLLGKDHHHVEYGPDHIGKHGEQPYPKMRRKPK